MTTRHAIVVLPIAAAGLTLLILLGVRHLDRFGDRVLGHFLELERLALEECAEQACSLPCSELRVYALTNYIAFLETHRTLLLLKRQDLDYHLFRTHARLFNLQTAMSNRVRAEEHYRVASNLFHRLTGQTLYRELLATNALFLVPIP